MWSPLEQFDLTVNNNFKYIEILFSLQNLSFFDQFNSAFFLFLNNFFINDFFLMLFRIFIIFLFITFFVSFKKKNLIPTYFTLFFELIYDFLAKTFREQIGYKAQNHFPFISSLFFFIVLINLIGMIPYEGAVASQGVFSLSLSFTVFLTLTLIGFVRQKLKFLLVFIPPKGIPIILIPLLVLIEIVSYLSRGISLGVRLFANIMAGHTLLFIFSSFILNVNVIIGLTIFIIIFAISCLEFMIALLQAYVFFVLTLIYFRDSIQAGH
jgi:F-type H+-transporting ATPase subunit a